MGGTRKVKPQVLLLGAVALLNDASSDMVYPLLPLFLTLQAGATPLIVGIIEGLAEATAAILKYTAGTFSDRLPFRKPLVIGGYGLTATSRVIIAAAGAWPIVLAGRLLDRTGKGIRSAPRDAMIADVTPVENRGLAFGTLRALDHTGAVIGPLIAALLLWLGWSLRAVFWTAVVPTIVGVILLFFIREQKREQTISQDKLERPPLDPRFRKAVTAIGLFSLGNSSDAFLLLQASAMGVDMIWIPLLWAAHHAVKAVLTAKAGAWADATDHRRMILIGWSLYAVLYYIFPFTKTTTGFLTLFVVYAIPFALTEGAERAWIAQYLPSSKSGRGFGIYHMVNGAGVLVGTALFGLLYQVISPVAAFHVGAGFAVLAVMSIFMQIYNDDQG